MPEVSPQLSTVPGGGKRLLTLGRVVGGSGEIVVEVEVEVEVEV